MFGIYIYIQYLVCNLIKWHECMSKKHVLMLSNVF